MATLKLRVSDKVLDKVIWLLRQFKKDELEIIDEGDDFAEAKKELEANLNRLTNNEARFFSIEEAEGLLESTIRKNEN